MGWKDWRYTKRGALIGICFGIIPASINFLVAGILGSFSLIPLNIFPNLWDFVFNRILNCSGEGCWGYWIILGSLAYIIEFLIWGLVIGWIIEIIKNRKSTNFNSKIKSRKYIIE